MTSQEKSILDQERKQIKGFLAAVREENATIGKRLASMVSLVGSMRASQLGVELMIMELEEKLK